MYFRYPDYYHLKQFNLTSLLEYHHHMFGFFFLIKRDVYLWSVFSSFSCPCVLPAQRRGMSSYSPLRGTAAQDESCGAEEPIWTTSREPRQLLSSVPAPKSYPGYRNMLSCLLPLLLSLPQYDFSTQLPQKVCAISLWLSSFSCSCPLSCAFTLLFLSTISSNPAVVDLIPLIRLI